MYTHQHRCDTTANVRCDKIQDSTTTRHIQRQNYEINFEENVGWRKKKVPAKEKKIAQQQKKNVMATKIHAIVNKNAVCAYTRA